MSRSAHPVPPDPALAQAPLTIRGLRKSFGGRTVLAGLDLDLRAGEFLALLGANGSGKSTALRCVVGLETPDGGTIRVHGHEIGDARSAQVRRSTAMVFQQIHLVHRRTVLDNVCAGALGRLPLRHSLAPVLFPRALREEAMACLDRVGMADRAAERAGRLSGGQRQRVAIARALCQRATVVLADEPVSALDPAAAEQVVSLLAGLAREQGLAVAAVLHQPDLARRHADRLVGLLGGRVAVDTSPGAVSEADLAALYAPTPGREAPALPAPGGTDQETPALPVSDGTDQEARTVPVLGGTGQQAPALPVPDGSDQGARAVPGLRGAGQGAPAGAALGTAGRERR
ncbi:phosphonate ABC transporter ATP-binding protein [Sphaerisporangium fuscum]|uniref:phosphonate ABC transporter ATP-binding protein n=1 Tax=Sphaerisporangium fuscum TaxID=2835868 RepID=UPI001BDD8BED|nr:ATP-binding cassette domain-containing protein [Sphaerisporangium fuscum]